MLGAATTVNDTPLLFTPLAFTTTLPVVAPVGTVATIDVALQLVIVVAVVPLNFTVLVPWVDPKFVPVIVTEAPTAPDVGDKLVMLGAATTVNAHPVAGVRLLPSPPRSRSSLLSAPCATIDVALQLPIVVAVVPLNCHCARALRRTKIRPRDRHRRSHRPRRRRQTANAWEYGEDTPLLAFLLPSPPRSRWLLLSAPWPQSRRTPTRDRCRCRTVELSPCSCPGSSRSSSL